MGKLLSPLSSNRKGRKHKGELYVTTATATATGVKYKRREKFVATHSHVQNTKIRAVQLGRNNEIKSRTNDVLVGTSISTNLKADATWVRYKNNNLIFPFALER